MNEEIRGSDAELGRRLGEALRAEADAVRLPDDAWGRFLAGKGSAEPHEGLDRAVSPGHDTPTPTGQTPTGSTPGQTPTGQTPTGQTPTGQTPAGQTPAGQTPAGQTPAVAAPIAIRRRTWRAPMIAAAAVVAIAVIAAVLVTRRGAEDALSLPAACDAAAMTSVSVDLSGGEQVGGAGGVAAPSSTGYSGSGRQPESPTMSASAKSDTSTWAPGSTGTGSAPPIADVAMGFGGSPPSARMCLRSAAEGGAGYGGVQSDGTPLGYLTMLRVGSLRCLVGAVGPGVEQVQVQAMPGVTTTGARTPSSADIDPGFSMSSHLWMIDGGKGTPWSLAEAATTVWTDLGGGRHGFALLLPEDAGTAEVSALDGRGTVIQLRSVDLATGRSSDEAAPMATTTFGPGTPADSGMSSPVRGSGSPAASPAPSVPESAATRSTGGPASCTAASATTLGISDVGFGQAGVEYALDGHGGLCFLDVSTGVWAHEPGRRTPISAVGLTGSGTVVDLATGAPSTVRFVWGAVTDQVTAVHVTAVGGSTAEVLAGLTEAGDGHTRVFLFRVPATGSITVTAVGGSGATLDAISLP
jgi:hypothetical protein